MTKEQFGENVKAFFTRLGRRNLIIICVVLLVAVAATVNWVIVAANNKDDLPTGNPGDDTTSDDVNAGKDESDSYFVASQLSRQKARDEALEVLQSVVDDDSIDEEAKATALADISKIAQQMEAEANVETLVRSKGFDQCVAVISEKGISVVVDVNETALTAAQIAQINTIVYEQTGITPDKTVIIEK